MGMLLIKRKLSINFKFQIITICLPRQVGKSTNLYSYGEREGEKKREREREREKEREREREREKERETERER